MHREHLLLGLMLLFGAGGCGVVPETVPVTGRVDIAGQQADNISVQFVPDSADGKPGFKASGVTDGAGRRDGSGTKATHCAALWQEISRGGQHAAADHRRAECPGDHAGSQAVSGKGLAMSCSKSDRRMGKMWRKTDQ